MKELYLHIGTEKTGTTTIQQWLNQNRQQFSMQGMHPLASLGSPNAIKVAAYAQGDEVFDDLRVRLGVNAARLEAFRREVRDALSEEVAASKCSRFVVSNEHCHSRLTSPEAVERLRDLFAPMFDTVKVVVYLRRQDKVAVSLYSTAVRNGGVRETVIDQSARGTMYYDYAALLRRWSGVFGNESIVPRLFGPGDFSGGSLIHDFASVLGLSAIPGELPDSSNESLPGPAQEFLRRINQRLPLFVDGELNPARGNIEEFVANIGSGRGRLPARAEAEAFYDSFREGNDWVRQHWFQDRDIMFDEDFSDYPEEGDPPQLSTKEALDITAKIWSQASQQRRSLMVQNQRLRERIQRLNEE